jgi:hypothetical protein
MRNLLATLANRDESEGALGRHGVMLASLIFLLAALPFGHAIAGGGTRFPVLLVLVLSSAAFVNSHQRWVFVVASLFWISAVVGIGYSEFTDSNVIRFAAEVLGLMLLGFTTLVMFNSLIQTEEVSMDTVVGGICVYLLIGLCFAMVFILMTHLIPGSFSRSGIAIERIETDPSAHATTLLFFSFVTLTTLGYGDVTPVDDMAQMFAVSEALIGQLYLAIFVARLVALYVRQAREQSSKESR